MSFLYLRGFIPTANLVLIVAGYSFYTSLLSNSIGSIEESRGLTLYFRLFEVAILSLVTFYYFKVPIKRNNSTRVLYMFWGLILLRFFYDAFVRTDIYFPDSWKIDSFAYMVPLTLWPMITVSLSYNSIDFNKALLWSYVLMVFVVLMSVVKGYSTEDMRMEANLSMGSISTGHLGLSALILSIYLLIRTKAKGIKFLVIATIAVFSFLLFLWAGSRGPVLAGIVIGVVILQSLSKSNTKSLVLQMLVIMIVLIFSDAIVSFVQEVAPILTDRFTDKMDRGGQLHDRIKQYEWAWREFKENPLFGNAFALFTFEFSPIGVGYTHNAFLEALMQTGIVGGSLFVYLYIRTYIFVIQLLRIKSVVGWVGLLTIQQMMKVMVSGAFYLTPLISIGMIIVFRAHKELNYNRNERIKKLNTQKNRNEIIPIDARQSLCKASI